MLVQPRHLSLFAVAGLVATCSVAAVSVLAPLRAGLPTNDGAACAVLDASNGAGDVMGQALRRRSL